MLVVFSPIFVTDTKIIFRYDFVASLMTIKASTQEFHVLIYSLDIHYFYSVTTFINFDNETYHQTLLHNCIK